MYMSPEQVNGEKIDKLTDIYSLGVTLFYMAVGKPPYENSNAIKMGIKIISDPFPTAKEFYPGVSNKIEAIIKKATQKDKTDRYQNCEEFRKDLDSKNVVAPEQIKAKAKTQVVKKEKKFKLSNFIAVAVVLLLVAGYFLYFNNNANTPPETYLVDGQEIILEDLENINCSQMLIFTDSIWLDKSTMQPATCRCTDKGEYVSSPADWILVGLIINGLKEGLWEEETWEVLHADTEERILSHVKKKGSYKGGKKEGLHKVWFENGQLESEGTFKDGNKEGVHKLWYENGQLKIESTYKNGEIDGLFREWHSNGQLSREGTYKDGKKEGVHKDWHSNGQLSREGTYKDGSCDFFLLYFP